MRKVVELYPESRDYSWDDYQPMVEEFGSVILQESDDDYQGSTWVLYQDGERIGWLRFGWGSCSGCDALQACDTIDEVQELMDFLWQSIRWFDTRDEALKFFVEHDWEGDWDYGTDAARTFVKKSIELLKGAKCIRN
jgi:hypothetical protein